MSNVVVVARKEFKTFFQTPIGYVFLVAFTALASWMFFYMGQPPFLVQREASLRGLYGVMPILFVVYAPALTMRLWAEEKRTGTFEVLMTMPLRERDAVLGKFLAAAGLVLASLLCLIPVLLVVAWLGDPDPGPVIGGALGALLLGAAYVSVGLAVSAMTENQIIAFIAAMVLSFVFYLLSYPGLQAVFPEFFAAFLNNLSLNTHFSSIARGVIDSRDLLYYVSFIGFFLYLNVWAIRRHRTAPANLVLVAGILVMLNYVGGQKFVRLDLTEDDRYTLSGGTKNILADLPDDLRLTAFLSSDLPSQFSNLRRDIEDTLSELEFYAGGRLRVEIADPSTSEDARAQADKAGVPEVPVQQYDETSVEARNAYMGMLVEYRSKSEVIPVVSSPDTLEYDLMLRVDKITRLEEVKVAFQLSDPYGGMSIPGMPRPPSQDKHSPTQDLRTLDYIIGTQFETETVDLKSAVPDAVKTMIVCNAGSLDEVQQYHLDQFLMRGGNLVVLAEGTEPSNFGGGQMPSSPFMRSPVEFAVADQFSQYGFQINGDVLLDQVCATINQPMRIENGMLTLPRPLQYPAVVSVIEESIVEHPITQGIRELLLPFASSVDLDPKPGVESVALVRTSPNASHEESDMALLDPSSFQPGSPLDPENYSEQFVIAGLLSGEFRSYFSTRGVPQEVVDALRTKQEVPEAGSDEDVLELPGMEGLAPGMEVVPDPAANGHDDESSGETTDDVPGGGLRGPPVQEGHEHEAAAPEEPVTDAAQQQEAAEQPVQDEDAAGEDAEAPPPDPAKLEAAQQAVKEEVGFLEKSPPDTRILVVGNAEFVLDNPNLPDSNLLFVFNAVNFLSSNNDLSEIRAKRPIGRPFPAPTEGQAFVAKLVGVYLTPILLFLAGILVYLWRRSWRPAWARQAMGDVVAE